MTTVLTLDFEGTNGAAVTVGGSIAAVSGTVTYATAAAFTGSTGLSTGASGTTNYVAAAIPLAQQTTRHSGTVVVKDPPAMPSSSVRVLTLVTAGGATVASIRLHSDGRVDIADAANTRQASTALVTWTAGSPLRLRWEWTPTAGAQKLRVRVYLDPSTALDSPDEEIVWASTGTSTATQYRIGYISSVAATDTTFFDAFALDSDQLPGYASRVWVGAPTTDGFRVTARTDSATAVRLVAATDPAAQSVVATFGPTTPDADGYVSLTATGLTPGQVYYWQLSDLPAGFGAPVRMGGIGRARTAPSGAASFTVAFGNCNTSDSDIAHAAAAAWLPDMFWHLGDWTYADISTTNPDDHTAELEQKLQELPGFKTLVRTVPTMYVRSDHDGGGGDNADPGPAYTANLTAYQQAVPHPPLVDASRGAFFAFTYGRVRFVAIDTRNLDRSPGAAAQSSSKTMLGATQKAWLNGELLRPEPVKVIMSDNPWYGAASLTVPDKWAAYDHERTELGQFIAGNDIRVLYVFGDLHSVNLDDGALNAWGGFPVANVGPLSQTYGYVGGPYGIEYREAVGVNPGRNYGQMTVTDTGDAITFAITAVDVLHATTRGALAVTFALTAPGVTAGTTEPAFTATAAAAGGPTMTGG